MMERQNALEIMIGSAKSAMNWCVTQITNVILVTRPAEVSVTRPADVAVTRPADVANDWFYDVCSVEWEGDGNVDAANVVSFALCLELMVVCLWDSVSPLALGSSCLFCAIRWPCLCFNAEQVVTKFTKFKVILKKSNRVSRTNFMRVKRFPIRIEKERIWALESKRNIRRLLRWKKLSIFEFFQ